MPQNPHVNQTKLKTWVTDYKATIVSETNETRSCLFDLQVLKDFLKEIEAHNKSISKKEKIDGIRIYLVRSGEIDPKGMLKDKKTCQMGFAIIPATNYKTTNIHQVSAKDCTLDEQLPWIVPGYSHETSGLCPNNCNSSL